MLIRLEALELAANAADDNVGSDFALNAIQVKGDGSVVVTDGTQMLRIRAAASEPGLFDALLPVEERGYDEDVLVDAADAKDFKAACRKALKKAGKKRVEDGGEPVHVVIAKIDDSLTLATQDGIVERRFVIKQSVDAKYPDVTRVIPTDVSREIVVSIDLLLKMLRTLKRLRCGSVRLGLTNNPNKPITVSALSLAGEIDGCLMPMRDDSAKHAPDGVDPSTGEFVNDDAA